MAPEVHQLITEWDTLPSDVRGERTGYVLGKYGSDLIIPGALVKATSKGLKGAQEMWVAHRGLQTAEQTLLLESASQLANGENISKVIQAKFTTRAEELGFTVHEIAQLEGVGKIKREMNVSAESASNISLNMHFADHALQRAIERGISGAAIFDTVDAPLKIEAIKIDQFGRPSQRIIGRQVEVVLNPETQQIVSVNKTSTKK